MDLNELLGSKKVAFCIFFILALLFLLPIFSNVNNWGDYDWDQHFFYHGSARNSILKFNEFPLWNPFYCGGNPLLANPQSVFLSPFFLFVLLFGTVLGLKIEIIAYLVLGLFGMFLLSRKMGLKIIPSYFSAVVFMFSSWFAVRVLVGHTTFFPFALLPWAFLFYLYSEEKKYFVLLSALIMAVMFLSGGIYPFYFSALFLGLYALFESFEKKSMKPIGVVLLIFLFAILFSSVKLIPMLEFAQGLSQQDIQHNSFQIELKGLLSRDQDLVRNDAVNGRSLVNDALSTKSGEVAWGWHEYSAYIGIIAIILALVSILNYKKSWKLLLVSAFFFVLSLGDFSPIPLWDLAKQLPLLGALHGPSRLMIMFVFCIALLAGKALSDIKPINNRQVAVGLLLIVLFDLFLVSRPLLNDAFPIEPISIQTADFREYIHVLSGDQFHGQYPYMLQNMDTLNCYERIHPSSAVVPQILQDGEINKEFIGNAYLRETNRSFDIVQFSPNKVIVAVDNSSGTLVLNENYLPGWHAKGKDAFSYSGLIAASVDPADKQVEFYYLPESIYIGAVISLIGAVLAGLLMFRWRQ